MLLRLVLLLAAPQVVQQIVQQIASDWPEERVEACTTDIPIQNDCAHAERRSKRGRESCAPQQGNRFCPMSREQQRQRKRDEYAAAKPPSQEELLRQEQEQELAQRDRQMRELQQQVRQKEQQELQLCGNAGHTVW